MQHINTDIEFPKRGHAPSKNVSLCSRHFRHCILLGTQPFVCGTCSTPESYCARQDIPKSAYSTTDDLSISLTDVCRYNDSLYAHIIRPPGARVRRPPMPIRRKLARDALRHGRCPTDGSTCRRHLSSEVVADIWMYFESALVRGRGASIRPIHLPRAIARSKLFAHTVARRGEIRHGTLPLGGIGEDTRRICRRNASERFRVIRLSDQNGQKHHGTCESRCRCDKLGNVAREENATSGANDTRNFNSRIAQAHILYDHRQNPRG